jgi:hypothetical protein
MQAIISDFQNTNCEYGSELGFVRFPGLLLFKNPLGNQRYRLYVTIFKIQIGKQIQFLSSSVLSNAVLFHSVITEVWKARKPMCSQLKGALTEKGFLVFSSDNFHLKHARYF